MSNVITRIEDLPVFAEIEDRNWAMNFHSRYDELFARPYQGPMRTSTGDIVAFTNADVGALRVHPAVSHQRLESVLAYYSPDMDHSGLRKLFAPSTFVLCQPEHAPAKQLISHVVSQRAVARWRESLNVAVRRALESAVARPQIEFGADVAQPILQSFWKEALGLDEQQTSRMIDLTRDISKSLRSFPTREEMINANRASGEFMTELSMHMKRTAQTADYPYLKDLIAQVDSMDPSMVPSDPYATVAAAMLDGFGTLIGTQSIMVVSLLDAGIQPAQYRGVATFASDAFMEALRLNSPVNMIARGVVDDFKYGELHIPKGSNVILLWMVSGRDPTVFADPNTFVLNRGNRSRQYSFGGGPYICGGRNLARIIGETLLAQMAELGITIERTAEAEFIHDRAGYDVVKLPVRLGRA